MTVSLSGDMPINDQANPRYTTMGDSTHARATPSSAVNFDRSLLMGHFHDGCH